MSTGRWSTALSTDAAQSRHHHSASHDVMRVILAGVTACAMLFASFSIVGTQTALAAGTGRDSYTDTLGNADFEAARAKYGLTKDMKNGAILHAWM